MNKLTADYAAELHEAVKLFISQPLNFPLSRSQIMEVARIALPILEQQERGEGEWIEWGGYKPPISDEALVDIKFRDGSMLKGSSNSHVLNWADRGFHSDIIAYRIIPEQIIEEDGSTK